MFWARGMVETMLKPGGKRSVLLRRSLQYERHAQREARWSEARLCRATSPMKIEVPAGEFVAEAWRAELEGGTMMSSIRGARCSAPHFGVEFIGGRARSPGRLGSSQVLADESTGRRVRTEQPRLADTAPRTP